MMSNKSSRDQARQEAKLELEKLKKEFLSVKFRWLMAVFFILGIVMVTYLLISGDQPEVLLVHPIHFTGNAFLWFSIGSTLLFGAVIVVSWILSGRNPDGQDK